MDGYIISNYRTLAAIQSGDIKQLMINMMTDSNIERPRAIATIWGWGEEQTLGLLLAF